MNEKELNNWRKYKCVLTVDLHYPDSIKERTKEFPLCPEHKII